MCRPLVSFTQGRRLRQYVLHIILECINYILIFVSVLTIFLFYAESDTQFIFYVFPCEFSSNFPLSFSYFFIFYYTCARACDAEEQVS